MQEFESITLAVPESVLSAFLREDVIPVCQQNINNLYEKIFVSREYRLRV